MTEHEYTDPVDKHEGYLEDPDGDKDKEEMAEDSKKKVQDYEDYLNPETDDNHYDDVDTGDQCHYLFKNKNELLKHMMEHSSINQ